jgi:hypothetical protein
MTFLKVLQTVLIKFLFFLEGGGWNAMDHANRNLG